MLKQRIIFGALGVILAIAVLTFCPVYIIGMCLGVITLIGICEFYNVTGIKDKCLLKCVGLLFSIISAILFIIKSHDALSFLGTLIIAFLFILMILKVFMHSSVSFKDVSVAFAGTVYVTVFFMHLLLVRHLEYGNLLIWVLFVSAWSTDTFAYFSGITLGKHKLCPTISPKKTVEGSIGGILGCVIFVSIFTFILAKFNDLSVNYLNVILFSLIASVFSQIGDLVASTIKREYDVKDYGNLIPGHGGILDRFDSVLLISPIAYYIMLFLPMFTK